MQVEAWLRRAARTAPDVTALQTPEAETSYAELLRSASAGAGELVELGARPGQRVAIALAPGIEFARALHACWLLGAIVVPVDLRLTRAERARIAAGTSVHIERPLRHSGSREDESETFANEATHDLDAVCAVIHTSGTTSAPRPVELTYGNFLWSALGSAVALGVDPAERWLCALPLSHVGGLSILVRSAIYATTAVVHERFEVDRALAALEAERVSLVSLVSTTLARLLDAGLEDPPALRCALTGGGPVPAALARRAREAGVPVLETYGLTECCSQAATAPLAAAAVARSHAPGPFAPTPMPVSFAGGEDPSSDVGAGVPLFCTSTEIAPDGEILLSGPTVARSALAADGLLHTGDLGRVDADGFLHVAGRKADTIVTGGENVAPSEVEAALEAHADVLEAAVVGREDPQWGEAVTAIVLTAPGAIVEESALREHCLQLLAPYKVPKRVEFTSKPLPRTASGKLLRREL
jgi:O-succinylbenzoic acid--CoA ligase